MDSSFRVEAEEHLDRPSLRVWVVLDQDYCLLQLVAAEAPQCYALKLCYLPVKNSADIDSDFAIALLEEADLVEVQVTASQVASYGPVNLGLLPPSLKYEPQQSRQTIEGGL